LSSKVEVIVVARRFAGPVGPEVHENEQAKVLPRVNWTVSAIAVQNCEGGHPVKDLGSSGQSLEPLDVNGRVSA
jgi:hypothetical protein